MLKRVLVLSDLHCGTKTGLTPPGWQQDRLGDLPKTLWKLYESWIEKYQPYDICLVNGDAIDGAGDFTRGVEQITTDRAEQCHMAEECIRLAEAEQYVVIAGTPVHAGKEEDWEAELARRLGGMFKSQGFLNINGVEFNLKHKISGSQLPHTRMNPLGKEILQNQMWALEGSQPLANVLIRSHVHYYEQVQHSRCLGFTTPGLQSLGSRYGARQCGGVVHFGILVIYVREDGKVMWDVELAEGKVQSSKSVIL